MSKMNALFMDEQEQRFQNVKDNLTRFHLQNHGVVPNNIDELAADLMEAFEPREQI